MATQPDREIELSQTNRGVGGVCVGVVPRVQSKLSRALHAHHGKKLLQDLQTQESAATKRAMVRFRVAREKGAMEFVECLGFSQEDTMKGPLWRETLRRSLGSHDVTELVGGMCHDNGCWQETTRLHAISCSKTGWSSLTHNRVLHQALARSLRESKVQFVVEDTWPFRQRASEQNGRLNPLRMDITTEAGALFDNHPRLKNKALLLYITIVNPCAGSNLGNAARHVGKHLADAVERKKNKYRGSFPANYFLLPLAMSTCGDVGSDVHALIKELAIRWVQHRSETYSNESQHLAEGTEVARLRRRFSFVLQQELSFRTRHHLCRQEVALASTRRPHSQGPASVQAHRTGGVTGSEGQEGANGVGGGIGVGGGNGDGNGDVNGHGDGDGAGAGTGVELMKERRTGTGTGARTGRERGQGRGWGPVDEHRMGTGTGTGTEARTVAEMGTGTTITRTRIGLGKAEGRRKSTRNRKIVVDAVRETGETRVESEKKCRKERVGSVAANSDHLGSNNEAGGGGHKVLRAQVIFVQAERLCPLCRVLSEVFVTSIIDSPLGGSMRVA